MVLRVTSEPVSMDTQRAGDGLTSRERVRQIIKLAIGIQITKSWKVFSNILNFIWKPDNRHCDQPLICLRGNKISGHYRGGKHEGGCRPGTDRKLCLTHEPVWTNHRCPQFYVLEPKSQSGLLRQGLNQIPTSAQGNGQRDYALFLSSFCTFLSFAFLNLVCPPSLFTNGKLGPREMKLIQGHTTS